MFFQRFILSHIARVRFKKKIVTLKEVHFIKNLRKQLEHSVGSKQKIATMNGKGRIAGQQKIRRKLKG